jgi:hypothetical protein
MAGKRNPPVVKTVQVYRDEKGEWRWRGLAGNGRIVADSAEGYRNRSYAHKMARSLNASARVEFA